MPRRNREPKPQGVSEPTPAQQAHADFTEELAEIGPSGTLDITLVVPADTDSPDAVEPGATATRIEPITTSITVGEQADFPAELGEVWGRADKPDGSTVLVTTNGQKYRRAAGSSEWVRAI